MAPSVAVVVPTYNRVEYLSKAIEGLLRQTLSPNDFEIIVVDNASTDDTKAQVSSLMTSAANLHYLFESTLGLNAARNTGWRAARAPYVAFLDDDAIPADDWVERIARTFEEVTPRPACVGGRVESVYETPPPAWLQGLLLDYLTEINHSPTPIFLVDIIHRQKLAGANFAFDRAALDQIGGFIPSLDRVGDKLISGGDVFVQLQLEKLGMPIYYDPRIRVRHHVSSKRLTRQWMADRAYWGGVSDALLSYLIRPNNLWWAARTLAWGVRSAAGSPRLMARLMESDERTDFVAKCAAWHRLGFVVGAAQAVRRSLAGDH